MTTPFGCFDCNGDDHWAQDCPERIPVTTKKEHEARIARYVDWFWDHRITLHQKRKLIEAENEREKQRQRKAAAERKSA